MKVSRYVKESYTNLYASKLRSLLALLGILVGTASVVAMVSGGELAANEALRQFKTLGTDLLAVTVNNRSQTEESEGGPNANLSLAQAEQLRNVNTAILDVAAYTQVFKPLQFNGREIDGSILGVTDRFASLIHIDMREGRFIAAVDRDALFCVIGDKIYQQIKQQSWINPMGQQIQIGENYFTVIGVAKPWPENSFVYANIDNTVLVPILTSAALSKYAVINNILIRLTPGAGIEKVQASISRYLSQVLPDKQLFFRSAKELIARMAKQSQILTVFLGLVGGISLLVGGIGVMNIMLVSVIERKREIGIRLAVGARRSHIQALFLMEAAMLSLTGGIAGVLMGLMIAYLIAIFSHWHFAFFIWPPLMGFSVSVVTGVFFGFYPAYKASRLEPIEALKAN